jgi:hypothetical protein
MCSPKLVLSEFTRDEDLTDRSEIGHIRVNGITGVSP